MTGKEVTTAIVGAQKALSPVRNDSGMETSLAKMEQIIEQAASLVILLEGRLRDAEAVFNQQVYISGRDAKSLTRAVQCRARAICDDAGVDYHQAGEIVRKAIYRAIRDEYGIETLYDMPQIKYFEALDSIRGFKSFTLLKRLRAMRSEGNNSG
ncbi:MAG: hypothetical protein IJ662_03505 [Clostridia bacterium]|nr:hypothetical protein [Clostridia bacterium]